MLVGGVLFEIVTGVLNIQYDYIFGFSFYTAHYFGAWVFIAGFVAHVAVKLPTMIRSLRSRSFRTMLRTSRADTVPEPLDEDGLVAPDPDPPTLSRPRDSGSRRRRLVARVGADRRPDHRGVDAAVCDPAPARAQLRRWQRSQRLPDQPYGLHGSDRSSADRRPMAIATTRRAHNRSCSTAPCLPRCRSTPWSCHSRVWRAGRPFRPGVVFGWRTSPSPQAGPFRVRPSSRHWSGSAPSTMRGCRRIRCSIPMRYWPFRVNGAELSPDHGYPARIIVPALPGVHCTKWVASIEFQEA